MSECDVFSNKKINDRDVLELYFLTYVADRYAIMTVNVNVT